jgi:secondary thiamine-phosphate synthase enzyme
MLAHSEIAVTSRSRCQWIDITSDIALAVSRCGMTNGICLIASLHTTAGITINENADPDVGTDFFHALEKMVPAGGGYLHSEGNSDSHVKASLVGLSVQVPVKDGRLVLGTWQSVYFCEFDGPRKRKVAVTMMGEQAKV